MRCFKLKQEGGGVRMVSNNRQQNFAWSWETFKNITKLNASELLKQGINRQSRPIGRILFKSYQKNPD